MECKCRNDDEILSCYLVLIETYWNVNATKLINWCNSKGVLIETYWNVNTRVLNSSIIDFLVLIETYWNVNEMSYEHRGLVIGINRNILECKLLFLDFKIQTLNGINRNILECK